MSPEELVNKFTALLSKLTQTPLALKLRTDFLDKTCRYYEITGKNSDLSPEFKANLLGAIYLETPFLMKRWGNQLSDNKFKYGTNYIGITSKGELIITEDHIPSFLFIYDPRSQHALNALLKKLHEEIPNQGDQIKVASHGTQITPALSKELRITCQGRQIALSGPTLCRLDHTLLDLYLTGILGLGLLCLSSAPAVLKGEPPVDKHAYRAFVEKIFKQKNKIDKIIIPLSAFNVISNRLGINYTFEYLGHKIDNSEVFTPGAGLKELGRGHLPYHERELFDTTVESAARAIFQPTITSGSQDAQKQARDTFLKIESNQNQDKQGKYLAYAKL